MAPKDAQQDDESAPLKSGEFLALAALRGGQSHGYAIAQEIAALSDGRMKLRPGNLYRVLDRLLERGLLEVAGRRPARALDDERRTYYRLTPLGKRVLATETDLLANVIANVMAPPRKA